MSYTTPFLSEIRGQFRHTSLDCLIAFTRETCQILAPSISSKAEEEDLGQSLVEERIEDLREAFDRNGQAFPDRSPPDLDEAIENFNVTYRDRMDALAANFPDPHSAEAQAARAQEDNRLRTEFGQQLDSIIQPYYGVDYFIWQGGECPECADLDGSIGEWGETPEPPAHPNCGCTAAPYFGDPYPDRIEPVYPIESALLALLPIGRLAITWRNWISAINRNTEWTLSTHKSPTRWSNQINSRNWTPAQITRTIKYGKRYSTDNNVNKENGATRYVYEGRYVVRDNKTKEILQISGEGFKYE